MKKKEMKKRIKELEKENFRLKDDNQHLQEMWSYHDNAFQGILESLVLNMPSGFLDDEISRIRDDNPTLLYISKLLGKDNG
jgi:hypothetical protein